MLNRDKRASVVAAALGLMLLVPATSSLADDKPAVELEVGPVKAKLDNDGQISVKVKTGPSNKQKQARAAAARNRWVKMAVNRSEALKKYKEYREILSENQQRAKAARSK